MFFFVQNNDQFLYPVSEKNMLYKKFTSLLPIVDKFICFLSSHFNFVICYFKSNKMFNKLACF